MTTERSASHGDTAAQLSGAPRICVLSARHLARQVFRSAWYEAEDVLLSATGADLIVAEPPASPWASRLEWRLRRLFTANRQRRQTLIEPGAAPIRLSGRYDLFVLI